MPRARATEPGREPYQHRGARAAPLRAPHFFFLREKRPTARREIVANASYCTKKVGR